MAMAVWHTLAADCVRFHGGARNREGEEEEGGVERRRRAKKTGWKDGELRQSWKKEREIDPFAVHCSAVLTFRCLVFFCWKSHWVGGSRFYCLTFYSFFLSSHFFLVMEDEEERENRNLVSYILLSWHHRFMIYYRHCRIRIRSDCWIFMVSGEAWRMDGWMEKLLSWFKSEILDSYLFLLLASSLTRQWVSAFVSILFDLFCLQQQTADVHNDFASSSSFIIDLLSTYYDGLLLFLFAFLLLFSADDAYFYLIYFTTICDEFPIETTFSRLFSSFLLHSYVDVMQRGSKGFRLFPSKSTNTFFFFFFFFL